MKKEKNRYFKDKYKFVIKEQNHEKNKTEKLEMNLSYQTKIKIKNKKKLLNNIESTSPKNKKSISPNQSNLSKDKIFLNNFLKAEKQNNNNNSQKKSIKINSSSGNKNILNKDEKPKEIEIEMETEKPNINNNSLKNNDFYNIKKNKLKSKIIQSSKSNNNNSKNYNTSNNLNLIYTNNEQYNNEQYNNDLFSNLFIDTSSDNKNILVSELDIELSNMDQSNCNKKNDKSDKKNINIIEDEEDTNQKSNEHMNVYKKIELRFKSKLEKSLNNYFQKNGTNFYIGDSISKQLNKEVENYNSKSNKKFENINEDNKTDIKKLINSDRKMTHNINFTKDLKKHKNNKSIQIIDCNKLKFLKNKLKENEHKKKFKKIISFKTMKFKINNNTLKNKKYSKKKTNKDSSTKNRIIKQKNNYQSKTKTIIGEKKIKAIYSKIISDANLIKENKNKTSKEKDIYTYRNINKNEINNDNNIGIRQSYRNNPYYLHSINSIKNTKSNNINKNKCKYNYNHLIHKYKNDKIKGEISILSNALSNDLNEKRKNVEEINLNSIKYNNNISYLNNKSVKNNNKLNRFFSYFGNDEKEHINNFSQKGKIINNNFYQKKNETNKNNINSLNYKIREKQLKYNKGLNTEINNFKTIKYFDINKVINKKNLFCNKKVNNENMKNKVKSDIFDDKKSGKSVFYYNKAFFLCLSPNKKSQILPHNSFKKKFDI